MADADIFSVGWIFFPPSLGERVCFRFRLRQASADRYPSAFIRSRVRVTFSDYLELRVEWFIIHRGLGRVFSESTEPRVQRGDHWTFMVPLLLITYVRFTYPSQTCEQAETTLLIDRSRMECIPLNGGIYKRVRTL